MTKPGRRLRRRHNLQRDIVDALPWPHPRPSRDPRLVGLYLSFIWSGAVQTMFGPPPQTVQGQAFSYTATVVFSIGLIICSVMMMIAAFCKSQYNSFGIEMGACVGFTGIFALYLWAAFIAIDTPWATNNVAIIAALAGGNAWRAQVLIRRLW